MGADTIQYTEPFEVSVEAMATANDATSAPDTPRYKCGYDKIHGWIRPVYHYKVPSVRLAEV